FLNWHRSWHMGTYGACEGSVSGFYPEKDKVARRPDRPEISRDVNHFSAGHTWCARSLCRRQADVSMRERLRVVRRTSTRGGVVAEIAISVALCLEAQYRRARCAGAGQVLRDPARILCLRAAYCHRHIGTHCR